MKHNWEYRPFDRVAHTITPISKIEKSEYLTRGLVPIISQEETMISGYWNNYDDVTPHQKPVVIFGDHSRVLKYIDFEFVVGADGVKIIEPKEGINTKFLYYYLHWINIPSLGYSRHFKLVKEALYAVPPKEIQERIVVELDKISELIEQNRELLRQLDSLAQSLFYDTFGDPVTNPKGWDVSTLEHVSSILRDGPFGSNLKSDHYRDSGVRVIRLQNIGVGYFSDSDKAYIDEDHYWKISKYTCLPGDIVMGTLGSPNLRACIVPEFIDKAIHKADCIRCVPKEDIVNSVFITSMLNTKSILNIASKNIHGATRARISSGQLKQLKIIVPPLSLQQQFAAQVEAIEAQKATVEKSIAELQTLLDSRMDYWFN